jgi:hypothetical protein
MDRSDGTKPSRLAEVNSANGAGEISNVKALCSDAHLRMRELSWGTTGEGVSAGSSWLGHPQARCGTSPQQQLFDVPQAAATALTDAPEHGVIAK